MRIPRPSKRWIFVVVCLPLLLVGGYLGALQLSGNFHSVVAGECYRSAQPTADRIAEYQTRYGIKTIINLRGANAGRSWYDAEVQEAHRLGLVHIDFGMSAGHELTAAQAQSLIALMRDAPKPILLHCASGSDRTGLAAALYLAAIRHSDEATCEDELSIRYGHLSVPFASAYAMDRTFEKLEPSLGLE